MLTCKTTLLIIKAQTNDIKYTTKSPVMYLTAIPQINKIQHTPIVLLDELSPTLKTTKSIIYTKFHLHKTAQPQKSSYYTYHHITTIHINPCQPTAPHKTPSKITPKTVLSSADKCTKLDSLLYHPAHLAVLSSKPILGNLYSHTTFARNKPALP
jgi:hypothetical protein